MVQNKPDFIKIDEIDTDIIKKLSFGSAGYLPSMTATIGGLAAHEVLKVHKSSSIFFYYENFS